MVTDERVEQLSTQIAALRDAYLGSTERTASKAHLQGGGRTVPVDGGGDDGAWLTAIFRANSRDVREQEAGKAALDALGAQWVEADPAIPGIDGGTHGGWGKATLGTTGPTGLYITPNALVTRLEAIATANNPMRGLLNVVDSVATPSIAIPIEAAAATRAVIAAWGSQKDNEDLSFNQYSATFYTLAKISDVANQLLRYSAGAAEQDVTQRLGKSMALGEAYYTLSGAGTTEPTGLLTALAAVGGHDTNKSAATTTIATSISGTIVSALATLEARAVIADGVLVDTASYWKMLTEAVSTFSVLGPQLSMNGGVSVDAAGQMRIFGIPIMRSPLMPAATGIAGAFKQATLYTGLGYRVDVSDQAGTRWDYNLTGFRAEEEIAFNATPYVLLGRFQRLTNLNT